MGKDGQTERLPVVTRQTSVWIEAAIYTVIVLALMFIVVGMLVCATGVPWQEYWTVTIKGSPYVSLVIGGPLYLCFVGGIGLYRWLRR